MSKPSTLLKCYHNFCDISVGNSDILLILSSSNSHVIRSKKLSDHVKVRCLTISPYESQGLPRIPQRYATLAGGFPQVVL